MMMGWRGDETTTGGERRILEHVDARAPFSSLSLGGAVRSAAPVDIIAAGDDAGAASLATIFVSSFPD